MCLIRSCACCYCFLFIHAVGWCESPYLRPDSSRARFPSSISRWWRSVPCTVAVALPAIAGTSIVPLPASWKLFPVSLSLSQEWQLIAHVPCGLTWAVLAIWPLLMKGRLCVCQSQSPIVCTDCLYSLNLCWSSFLPRSPLRPPSYVLPLTRSPLCLAAPISIRWSVLFTIIAPIVNRSGTVWPRVPSQLANSPAD